MNDDGLNAARGLVGGVLVVSVPVWTILGLLVKTITVGWPWTPWFLLALVFTAMLWAWWFDVS